MLLPTAQQYIDLISDDHTRATSFLRPFRFYLQSPDPAHKPFLVLGQSSVVFRAERNGRDFALRCFTAAERDSFRRWSEISQFLHASSFPWTTEVDFLDEEFSIEGQPYPAILMPWEAGVPLWSYLNRIIADGAKLTQLQEKILALGGAIEREGVAHGDLNLEHLLVEEKASGLQLKLIGYNAMFIPPFAGMPSLEVGTPGFQHPKRMSDDFYAELDRFSIWIFLAALEAFKSDPGLWKGRVAGNSPVPLLFSYRDLMDPERSVLFRTLRRDGNEALNFYLDAIERFCESLDLRSIEVPVLYDPSGKSASTRPKRKQAAAPLPMREDLPESEKPARADGRRSGRSAETAAAGVLETPVKRSERTRPSSLQTPTGSKRYIPENDRRKGAKKWILLAAIGVLLLTIGTVFALSSGSDEAPSFRPNLPPAATATTQGPAFTEARVRPVLANLYAAYNQRNLGAILAFYADNVDYYDASNLSKDSLRQTINSLFVSPAAYSCTPNYATLKITPSGDRCTVQITINEQLRPTANAPTERYATRIRYELDGDYRIRSEKGE